MKRVPAQLLFASMLAASPALADPIQTINLYANISSFNSAFGGQDPTRVIQVAAAQWLSEAGYRQNFHYVGTTSRTSCGIGSENFIVGVPGCKSGDNPACTTLGEFYQCPFGGFEVTIYLGAAQWSLSPHSGSDQDLQHVIQHELGHNAAPFSGNQDYDGNSLEPCVMDGVTFGGGVPQRYYCNSEKDAIHMWPDYKMPTGSIHWVHSSIWPDPRSSVWWDGGTLYSALFGYDLGVSLRTDLYSPQQVFAGTYNNQIAAGNYGPWALNLVTDMSDYGTRPTIAYDYVRHQVWLFYRDESYEPQGLDSYVKYAKSTDLFSWSGFSFVQTAGSTKILSRLPVGAAYDGFSDSIVVVFATYNPNGSFQTCSSGPFGCTNQLVVMTKKADDLSAWKGPYLIPGNELTSAPAVACENSTTSYECEAMGIGTGPQRHIAAVTFGLTSSGAYYATGPSIDTGGWTDYPPSIVYNGKNHTADFAAVVRGTDGLIYLNTKDRIYQTWRGWQSITVPGIVYQTPLAPSINYSDYYSDYQILFAQEP